MIDVGGDGATEERNDTGQLNPVGANDSTWIPDLFDLSHDMLCVAGFDGYFKRINPAWERTLGFSTAELMQKPFLDFVHPDDRAATRREAAAVAEGAVSVTFENRYQCKDGSLRWLAWSAVPNVSAGLIFAVARDISQQKAAELDLAKSDERLRSLLAGAPVAVVTVDVDGKFTFAAGSVFAALGIDPSSMLGLGVKEFFADRPDFIELWAESLKADFHSDVEFAGRSFSLRGGPYRLAPGAEPLGVLVVAFDDTERVRADTALRHSEAEAEQRMARRLAQQTVLLEVSRAGLEDQETPAFLARAAELVAVGTDTDFGTILEYRPLDNAVVRVAAYSRKDPLPLDATPIDASAIGLEALKAELRTPVALDFKARPDLPRSAWMVERGVVTSMAAAVGGDFAPFGVISVHSTESREFDAEDLQFMEVVSTVVSVAVQRRLGDQQRRMLLSRLVTAQEAERRAIAQDVHDDAVQVMTAANLRLELFRMSLTDPAQADAAEKLQGTISLATGRLRALLFQLSPPELDRHGLATALQRHLEEFQAETGVRWEMRVELSEEPQRAVQILLFRIFQEALLNVRKHARAAVVVVTVTSQDRGVLLRLRDDGAGFQEMNANRAGHLGLLSMRERAEIAGGWWSVSSTPGHGTDVRAWVPVSGQEGAIATEAAKAMALG